MNPYRHGTPTDMEPLTGFNGNPWKSPTDMEPLTGFADTGFADTEHLTNNRQTRGEVQQAQRNGHAIIPVGDACL